MNKRGVLGFLAWIFTLSLSAQTGELNIVDFTKGEGENITVVDGFQKSFTSEGLVLSAAKNQNGKLVVKGNWDLHNYVYVKIILENKKGNNYRFDTRIKGKVEGRKWTKPLWDIGWLKENETREFTCLLIPDYSTRKKNYSQMDKDFPNMRGMPDGVSFRSSFDTKLTNQIEISLPKADFDREFLVKRVYATKEVKNELYLSNKKEFFPFIDKYGQYKHDTWPGKITSDDDFEQVIIEEEKDLKKHKGSVEWNEFGGFANGPKYKATGQFRTEKIDGKWWVIDPNGALFFSSGVNSAGKLNVFTPFKGRENFFEYMPEKNDPEYSNYFKGNEFDFGKLAIKRKFGTIEGDFYLEKSLQRMKSWGLNTMGGWGNEKVSQLDESKKLPYTQIIHTTKIALNEKFPDVFDPKWEKLVRNNLKIKVQSSKGDPYLFGFFVDNEIHWYSPNTFAKKLIAYRANSMGKKVYVDMLEEEYKNIESFNSVAGTSFKNWKDLVKNRKQIKLKKTEKVNIEFYELMTHKYFSTIRKAIDEISPGTMYIGCRWHVSNDHRNEYNVNISAEYLDIISHNQYDNELVGFDYTVNNNIDKPYLISEFNFGALDSGKFYPGLGYAGDQRNRGEKYKNFMESALRDPNCVGAHWFMWGNSTTAGRSVVGENANCGIVSEMDSPYYELIEYMREVNYKLYNYRLKN